MLYAIEINITELCNLKCEMCPRSQGYPNENLHMSLNTIQQILESVNEFVEITGHRITFSITGRGEPSLHNKYSQLLNYVISNKNEKVSILLNTNGYKFEQYLDLYKKIEKVSVNVYYNHTVEEYENLKKIYSNNKNISVCLRHIGNEITPQKRRQPYNNRAGAVENEITVINLEDNYCHKPFQHIFIDWNGDYNLCCNDWSEKVVLGNIANESIIDYYTKNAELDFYKQMLKNNMRSIEPCASCNARCSPSFRHYFEKTH